jgi:RNA polymerase sigma factor (sigma-70 family)
LITETEYSIIQEICRNQCHDPDLVDDLIQEVTLVWINQDLPRQESIRSYFRFWVSRVISNQWKSTSSPFWKQYRSIQVHEPLGDIWDEPQELEDELEWDIKKAMCELFPSDNFLLNLYYEQGLSITEISKRKNIDRSWVSANLKRIRNLLKLDHDLFGVSQARLREIASEEIINYVGKTRLSMEEGTRILLYYRKLTGSSNNNLLLKENIRGALKELVKILNL